MYIPKLFQNKNYPAIADFITANSFAMLTSVVDNRPWVTHLPLELETGIDGQWFLHGHLSNANRQAKSLQDGMEVLVVFNGPHAYVSSGWYDHENVSTWNYIAVHVYGKLKVSSAQELYEHLRQLTAHHEKKMDKPRNIENMSAEMVSAQMKGITGFRIEVSEILGKWKLSQNRNDGDYKNVITELEKLDQYNSKTIAEEMKKLR